LFVFLYLIPQILILLANVRATLYFFFAYPTLGRTLPFASLAQIKLFLIYLMKLCTNAHMYNIVRRYRTAVTQE